ncbi:hypothetical protein BWQ96_04616 [Gracilariopsis chorda]|uniref:Uncharacterized protein n=1 Tax=Gracilariopsis chorda TaxID=448386 RepID=A0A2V3IU30_9FLOR|nr:hypothetical protein BWQ96_04616 [Gracilariopsis chorda]|eukprot:PXF45611.1 hypothetical protein BWQ96_04616 [Gracilariopsis chorda]
MCANPHGFQTFYDRHDIFTRHYAGFCVAGSSVFGRDEQKFMAADVAVGEVHLQFVVEGAVHVFGKDTGLSADGLHFARRCMCEPVYIF